MTNALNNLFRIITGRLNIHHVKKVDVIPILRFISSKIPQHTIAITEAELEYDIFSKTKSHDKILRACAFFISHPFSYTYNQLLYAGFLTTILKMQ
jgi:hypothetical protein